MRGVPPELLVAGMLEERNRLWRELREVTLEATLAERRHDGARARHEERLARLRGSLDAVTARERRVKRENPAAVAFPRTMIAFAEGCLALGEQLDADIYHAHDDPPLLAAATLRARHGGRIVYDAVEIPDHKLRSDQALVPERSTDEAFLRAYDLGILGEADTIMTVGPALAAHIRGMGFDAVAVENYRYYSEPEPSHAIRRDRAAADGDILALQLGDVDPASGFETVLEHWARLPSRFRLATLGTIRPDDYGDRLRDRAAALGVADRVTWLDPVPYSALADYASGADFMFIHGRREIPNDDLSLPNRVFDALAARLPICSSELSQIGEFIAEHEIGTTFDPDSFDTFIAAVEQIAANAASYRPALDRAAERCVWERHDERLREIYGSGKRVAMLGIRDLANTRRCHRIADTLLRLGNEVVIVGPKPPDSPDSRIVYHAVDLDGNR